MAQTTEIHKSPSASKFELQLMCKIAKRAIAIADSNDIRYDTMTCLLDLEFAHAEIPIDLNRLLEADDFNFSHDVFGIRRHMNRQTKKLEGCFVPRCAL